MQYCIHGIFMRVPYAEVLIIRINPVFVRILYSHDGSKEAMLSHR